MVSKEVCIMRELAHGTGREALLRAVIRVTAQRGLRGVTYRSVAEEAGVTHGLVAHHFGSRDVLIEEALAYSLQTSLQGGSLESDRPGFDGFALHLAELVSGDPEGQAFQYELVLEARRRPELLPLVSEVYASYRQAVGWELRRNGIVDDDLANVIFSALDGLVFQQVAFGNADATRSAMAVIRGLLRQHASLIEATRA
jgi:TetR/AcrR family transcriptional regulator, regulator of biofilm formation and stress response